MSGRGPWTDGAPRVRGAHMGDASKHRVFIPGISPVRPAPPESTHKRISAPERTAPNPLAHRQILTPEQRLRALYR